MKNSFNSRSVLRVDTDSYEIYKFEVLEKSGIGSVSRLPFTIKILLENLLRYEDGISVKIADIENLARWPDSNGLSSEIAFRPARVLMQDFTGVPAVVDLAAMRDAVLKRGGSPELVNPVQRTDLIIDHSVQVDRFGTSDAIAFNAQKEMERNRERYGLLRWAQNAFRNFHVVPPDTGICHQVNLEFLGKVVWQSKIGNSVVAYPDTLVGTDSHTTMINGLGILGWGVGGIEAEASMLKQPISMKIPEVIGFKLTGELPAGTTATDLVLTVTQLLRKKGVVGKFVEFYGEGLKYLTLPDRATIANMCPEYGATVGYFPVDFQTIEYLRFTGRDDKTIKLAEAYTKEQGLYRTDESEYPQFTDIVTLNLNDVEACIAGPKRPQDRIPLKSAHTVFRENLQSMLEIHKKETNKNSHATWLNEGGNFSENLKPVTVKTPDESSELHNGSVVIAAITSCTNTSNPAVMLGAGILAKKAVQRGLNTRSWIKTSLAPGSKVVTDYLIKAGFMPYLEALKFHVVGYGCTTCIGNSGPLSEHIANTITAKNLVVASVLSGNRNFEGRINPLTKANYLGSPPLVIAYALAGKMDINLLKEALGYDPNGNPVYLKDIWPTQQEIQDAVKTAVQSDMFHTTYSEIYKGTDEWNSLKVPEGKCFTFDPESTYINLPPYFDNMPVDPPELKDIENAHVLAFLGDTITTDHISPAGSIPKDSPAGQYLISKGVDQKEFNSYGSRRGNHEVMIRGTFANIRLKNKLVPTKEGWWTRYIPENNEMSIYDASVKYAEKIIPLIILAGKEYGTGSSRDWAAKGTFLLGIRAVIAESFERIHRSNLIGMGVLPLQFEQGETAQSLGLTGSEKFHIHGISKGLSPGKRLVVSAVHEKNEKIFNVTARIDTLIEIGYYQHGGVLQCVLRQILARKLS
ncbi:MAG: aconitate hydratase 1 [Candidatus Schekmanbacteria bacterium RBG_13_48_7]|uniref:Aconitate hydratase n=1 Tax=Candidatus Schekmanbacteria bacterium RBG_13_48_7 TaxID=1817878 RepID=A0A1F7S1S9_9BACT|nr:MAG: aconitate hydratase 1 [Candidatus Schekmanbacteria bacterium RBG_13_48_7]